MAGIIQRLAEKALWRMIERRSSLENPMTPLSFPAEWLLDIFNGGRTDSGIRVSEMTALQTDAVLSCVRIICNGIASLPLHVVEQSMIGDRLVSKRAWDHDQYMLLRLRPNEEMSSHDLRNVMLCHGLLWGNAYVEIQRDNGSRPIALWPRNPARTRPVRLTRPAKIQGTIYPANTLVYHTSEVIGDEISAVDSQGNVMASERVILAEDMIHLKGLSLDGRLGQSTIYLSRQTIGLALATEKYGSKFFGNGAIPRGVLEIPSAMEAKALENLRRSWQEAHGGENSHKTAVLEQGVKYTPIGVDPEKGQFTETRHFQRLLVAAIFNVPPHMIGEGSGSKSSVEQSSIEFLTFCVGPWLDKIEQEFKIKLFPIENGTTKNFYVKFDTHKLLYPDATSRSKYYQSGKNGGWLNTNDIRELEDMNPVEDGSGEVYWMPVNMQDAANPLTAPHIGGLQNEPNRPVNPEKPLGGAPQNPDKQPLSSTPSPRSEFINRYAKIYYPVFRDAAGRLLNRKVVSEATFNRCFTAALLSLVQAISDELAPKRSKMIPAGEFMTDVNNYLVGMRSNFIGVTPNLDETYAANEVRRAVETWHGIVSKRYNPNHADQQRHPDGKWHDGSKPLFVGRHATTDDDLNKVWSGWTDVKVNDIGEAEIKATIEKIKGLGIRRIVASDLARAKYTGQQYANALGVPMTTDWRLNALKLGDLEGLNEYDNAAQLKVYVDNPDIPVPGGESINQYADRSLGAIDEYQGQNEDTGPILVLTHSSVIAMYLNKIRGESNNIENSSELLTPAGVVQVNGKHVAMIAGTLGKGDAA